MAAKRYYSPKTIKKLFGQCGNQCAEPTCTNPIIAPCTEESDEAVVGQICHIIAAADNGPRGDPNLTNEQRNAPENLILLCGHHHPLVDKQFDTYPALLLRDWKNGHEAKFQQHTAEGQKRFNQTNTASFLQSLSDQQLEARIDRLRKARFLVGFNSIEEATRLADQIDASELSQSSNELRSKGLAWCARILATKETSEQATPLLKRAIQLYSSEETEIAKGALAALTDKVEALKIYAALDSPAGRAASLRTIGYIDGDEAAIAWKDVCQFSPADFDSDGRLTLIFMQLRAGRWSDALFTAEALTQEDFQRSPVLENGAALAYMLATVPTELRAGLISTLPFGISDFPLADDDTSLEYRAKAIKHFEQASVACEMLGVAAAADINADFALWLSLRNPTTYQDASERLKLSLSQDRHVLRRVNMALQFGVQPDIGAVEALIEKTIAINGCITVDAAFARFSLAFARKGPTTVTDYIEKYRSQLYQHLDSKLIRSMEVELFAKSGKLETAKRILAELVTEGIDDEHQRDLARVISESNGVSAISDREQKYFASQSLLDLVSLVAALEESAEFNALLPYARKLYALTGSTENALRIANTLAELADYDALHQFLSEIPTLVEKSTALKSHWSWAVYRKGDFEQGFQIHAELAKGRNHHNDRLLYVNLSIASGQWERLSHFSTEEWNKRAERSPEELLIAGRLAQATRGPHAKDLVHEAARLAETAEVFAGAYFHAVEAGWEDNDATGSWLLQASALSRDDGPIKSITIKEVMEMKPEWDKRQAETWESLRKGKLPMFAAAMLLNRSLIDFVLLQSVANEKENDARKRGVIYSFSGARVSTLQTDFKRIAIDVTAIFTLARLQLLHTVIDAFDSLLIPHNTLDWLFREYDKATFHQPSQIRDAHNLKRLIADGRLFVQERAPDRDPALAHEVGDDLASLLHIAKKRRSEGVNAYTIRSSPVHKIASLLEQEADLSSHEANLCGCNAVISKLKERAILTREEAERASAYINLHERPWPTEPKIQNEAEIYLDDLSVAYFRTSGVLDRLDTAGFKYFITDTLSREADRLIELEHLQDEQVETLNKVRTCISAAIKTGKIKAVNSSAPELETFNQKHPSWSILMLSDNIDAIIIDDRSFNVHGNTALKGTTIPTATTLELLADMKTQDKLSPSQYFAALTSLRRAGHQFVPISDDELLYQLNDVVVRDNEIVETAELRAIREGLLKARMANLLQIPDDLPWFLATTKTIAETIKRLWIVVADHERAKALCEWLLKLYDVRGWAPAALPGNERQFVQLGMASQLHVICTPPEGASKELAENYLAWIDERLLKPLERTEPETLDWLLNSAKQMISYCTATNDVEEESEDER